MIDNSNNPELKLAYKAKDGTEFYSFVNVMNIGAIRGLAADKARRFAEMNLTERAMRELIKVCKASAGAGDLVQAFSIIQEIDFRLNFICEENSTLDLVNIYFMLNEEDPEIPSETLNRKKHKIYETDPGARAFFLRIGVALMNKLSGKPEEDSLSYMRENQGMNDRINRYIAEESLISSIPTSTD